MTEYATTTQSAKHYDEPTVPLEGSRSPAIYVSVIVLNYNGAAWLERCLHSLRTQTIFHKIEVIVADNASPDGSAELAVQYLKDWPNARVMPNGRNLGFAEGNNRPARLARGRYLFFLNNDAWLEPACIERLLAGVTSAGAVAACPLVLNYEDDSFQSAGAGGFDVFGLATSRRPPSTTRPVLMPEGCGYLIERERFLALGGFDPEFFMFAEEFDLSWRVWIAGGRACVVPEARLHHRGGAQVNPQGGGQVIEFRTSDRKRFFANRNNLLVLLKNAQHLLLLLLPLQLLLLALEAGAALFLVRRWSFVKAAYMDAVVDCWRLRSHVCQQRRLLRGLRKRGDFWMLRFLRGRLNRWDEFLRMLRFGPPKVSAG
jgi:GT2 family glycosyltransferase